MIRDQTRQSQIGTSREWITYFEANVVRQRRIPWEEGAGVSDEELSRIVASLRGWQLGETSDGANLLAAARRYSGSVGDPEFLDAVRLFIAEEQRHGEMLGRFLDLAGVERASADWGTRCSELLDTHYREWRFGQRRS
ncbi:MAG: hypothetical protein ACFCD0_08745 [Gemmataceae bacterium]